MSAKHEFEFVIVIVIVSAAAGSRCTEIGTHPSSHPYSRARCKGMQRCDPVCFLEMEDLMSLNRESGAPGGNDRNGGAGRAASTVTSDQPLGESVRSRSLILQPKQREPVPAFRRRETGETCSQSGL